MSLEGFHALAGIKRVKTLGRFEKWMQRGSIAEQAGRVFNLFAAIVLLLGAVATVGTIRIEQRSEVLAQLTQVAFVSANMTRSVALSKDEMGAYRARDYKREYIESSLKEAARAIEYNKQLYAAASKVDPELAARVSKLDLRLRRVHDIMNEVGDAPRDIVETETFLGPRYDEIDATVDEIVAVRSIAAARAETASGEGLYEIQFLITALAAGVIIALVLVLAGKRMTASRVVSPIMEISEASKRIAAGETQLAIPGADRDDEIGTLSESLNVLRSVQEQSIEQAQRDHELALEKERVIQAERESQREAQARMLQALADKFEKSISEVANEVASASSQMHAAASMLADTVEGSSKTVLNANSSLKESTAGITNAASASDEFSMSIIEVSQQAGTSSERARRATEAARAADGTITGLTDSADRISQIIEVIAGIAQRTNLLALNASIEAARGGEAGRGFSVVASEVKELATQTGRATQEVEMLIREMQAATAQSAKALSTISREVRELETTAMSIASAVDQQAVASKELAQSIDLAARNTQDVSATIDDVSRVAMTSGSTATQVLSSSAHLSAQAELLRGQVTEFLRQVRAA